MKRAIEQAGSVCAGWISSCLFFCPSSRGDDESFHHQRSLKQKGAEREMQVCHTQPHLVPPMKLAVDSAFPRPSASVWRSSTPSLKLDSRPPSKKPRRTSLTLKRKSTAPLRISGPSEFRTVSSFATSPKGFHPDSFILLSPGQFQPLELSFEASGNALPDLPEFDTFQVEEECPVLTRPPRTLRTSADISRISRAKSHRPSSSFQLVRKPVGSGSRRSSLATMEQLMDKQVPSTHPLVPHFSACSPAVNDLTTSRHHSGYTRLNSANGCGVIVSKLEPRKEPQASRVTLPPRTPTDTTSTNLQDRPLPPIPVEDSPSSGTTQRPPTTPTETRPPTTPSENRNPRSATTTTTPTRSGRVTQWLFQSSNKTSPFASSLSPWKSTFTDKTPFRIRSRTLSGSTIASSLTSLTGGFKTTPSLSSNTTAAALARPPHTYPHLEKGFDVPTSFSRPYTPKQADESAIYPTIFESQQQHQHPQNGYDEFTHNYYTTYRRSAVGLAF
ncbi:hypothetical protein BDV26DRAFT_258493 [Aspergillus bertholletiae]|uniref:Uncharacterized protein n=1 Tax=Aspergillus bertholletiae TaxID=1226010 RepID=A0A5N7BDX8_9EURO|nr:hypothetical protein BDV26DRAFT_258493 [Aspergillus bertholletiae]